MVPTGVLGVHLHKKIGGEQIMWFQVSTGGNSFLKDEKL
jgi:hypothetical protein